MSHKPKLPTLRLILCIGAALGLFIQPGSVVAQFTPGPPFAVNTATELLGYRPVAARQGDTGFVVVWSQSVEDFEVEIFGRRFANDGTPLSNEFTVNTPTTYSPFSHDVSTGPDGSFVVVWGSLFQDGDNSSITARRFAADATPQSGEIIVNSYSTGNQDEPAVSVAADGSFVVAWGSEGSSGQVDQDGSSSGNLRAQRFSAAGSPAGTEFQVNTYTTNAQYRPDVAHGTGGNFVIVWRDAQALPGTVFGRAFDSSGAAAGTPFLVAELTTGGQRRPRIEAHSDGGFVVTWYEYRGNRDAFTRRLDATGTPTGSQALVNQDTEGFQRNPSVTALDEGGFAVVWEDEVPYGAYLSSPRLGFPRGEFLTKISAGVLDENFARVVDDFDISAPGAEQDTRPTVADIAGPGFVVVWNEKQGGYGEYAPTVISGRVVGGGGSTGLCGDANASAIVTASDALIALQTAVASASCPLCLCDVNSSGSVTATDALLTLQFAVSQPVQLNCISCS